MKCNKSDVVSKIVPRSPQCKLFQQFLRCPEDSTPQFKQVCPHHSRCSTNIQGIPTSHKKQTPPICCKPMLFTFSSTSNLNGCDLQQRYPSLHRRTFLELKHQAWLQLCCQREKEPASSPMESNNPTKRNITADAYRQC